jgi:hypothetical protein
MKRLFLALALAAIPVASHAEWFARGDSDGKLVLTGIAVDPQGTNAVYLTCENGGLFEFTTLTWNQGTTSDLAEYLDTKVTFGYRDKDLHPQNFSVTGIPVLLPWNVIAIQTKLTPEQSRMIAKPIFRGEKISITLLHANLQLEREPKVINGGVGLNPTIALSDACPGVKR